MVLFSGLMSYYPNQQGIRWFITDVFPLVLRCVPRARLVVAGAAPPRWLQLLARDHVEVTGYVPDIRPYIERASVVIAPLMIGGGTRVKILEAQAMARPVVSTSLGAEGLNLEAGTSALIADDSAAFAAQVVRLLTDEEYASHVALNGRAHVSRHFDWNRIGENASRLLTSRLGLTARRTGLHAPES
jgi:glycosyltransferase involved in cell wall biosynthesis